MNFQRVFKMHIIVLLLMLYISFAVSPNAYINPAFCLIYWASTGQILWWIYDEYREERNPRHSICRNAKA